MKVLFVSSGNNKDGISPIIKKQGESLIKQGIDVHFFTVKGKGIRGYIKSIKPLKKVIKQFNPDIIHSHYSLCGYISSIGNSKIPNVCSLMGSDTVVKGGWKKLILWYIKNRWDVTITKSEEMKSNLGFSEIIVLPNGVDTKLFKPTSIDEAREKLGWEKEGIHILFAANPKRPEKNYLLFQESIALLNDKKINTHVLQDVSHKSIPLMMNASNVVALTSHREGSPNVVKEAMACNRPIVSTNVGDVSWLLNDCEGCFISNSQTTDYSQSILSAMKHSNSKGRERINKLGLMDTDTANKLIKIYTELKRE